MTDDTETKKTDTPAPGGDDGAKTPVSFTPEQQAKVDEIVKFRLADRERQYAAERETEAKKKAEADRIAKLDGEQKLQAEFDAKLKEAEEARQKAEADLAYANAVAALAKMGYPEEFASAVIGKDSETTAANVAAFDKKFQAEVAKRISEATKVGAPKAGGAPSSNALESMMRKSMGLPAKS